MAIEARSPPSQFVFRLRRSLGGRAGWSGVIYQVLFVAALIWLGYEIVANARANLAAQRITSVFGYLFLPCEWSDWVTRLLGSYCAADSTLHGFFLSNRGLVIPKPIATVALEPFLIAAAAAIVTALVLRHYARKQLFDKGRKITICASVLGLIVDL